MICETNKKNLKVKVNCVLPFDTSTPTQVYDKVGIQAFTPDLDNTAFITQGGYCMFYLHWFINYVALK